MRNEPSSGIPQLWPPLAEIERDLCGAPADDVPIEEVASAEVTAVPPMPAALQEKLATASALRVELAKLPLLSAGTIRSLPVIGTDGTPTGARIGFVLDQPAELSSDPHDWQGWVVAGEADYAGTWDVLLDASDGPHLPSLAMVQTWNPLTLRIPKNAPVVGRLDAARLVALHSVAAEAKRQIAANAGPAIPGRVGTRLSEDGHPVVTGHPLTGATDPRTIYQQHYRELSVRLERQFSMERVAGPIVQPPRIEPATSFWQRLRAGSLALPMTGLATAATLLFVVGIASRYLMDQGELGHPATAPVTVASNTNPPPSPPPTSSPSAPPQAAAPKATASPKLPERTLVASADKPSEPTAAPADEGTSPKHSVSRLSSRVTASAGASKGLDKGGVAERLSRTHQVSCLVLDLAPDANTETLNKALIPVLERLNARLAGTSTNGRRLTVQSDTGWTAESRQTLKDLAGVLTVGDYQAGPDVPACP